MGYSLDFTPTKQKFCMQYRDIARREHTLEHEFGHILETLLEGGETFRLLARKTGISINTFGAWAKLLGLKSLGQRAPYVRELYRRNGRKTRKFHYDYEKTLKLSADGLTMAEIAKSFGVSRGCLSYWMRQAIISKGKLTAICEFCEVQFEKGRIDQRFCSNVCGTRYSHYLDKVARGGLGVRCIGDISACHNPECSKTWEIGPSSRSKYCSPRCRWRVANVKRTNQAVA